jgi:polar amino acid transport system substrate-binding protein
MPFRWIEKQKVSEILDAVKSGEGDVAMAARYLTDNGLAFVGVERIEEAYKLLDQDKIDAVVYDAPVLLYHALTTGRGKTQVVGRILQQEHYGIALPTGSPLRAPINEALLAIEQDGTYDALCAKWFGAPD